MYHLDTPIEEVTGVGDKTANLLAKKDIHTVLDLLLFLPLRYEDRSEITTIDQLPMDQLATFVAEVKSVSQFYKNGRSIQSATVEDETGKVKLMWFNNKWIKQRLQKGESYLFSGKYTKYKTITQPVVEDLKEDTIHTGRLVPVYSSLGSIKQGTFRRILKEVVTHFDYAPRRDVKFYVSTDIFTQLHFPDTNDKVIEARERLALEEFLSLMKISYETKKEWKKKQNAIKIKLTANDQQLTTKLPFQLTQAQEKATDEILKDIAKSTPMNRLLIGDVGSGKTVVAGIAAYHTVKNGHHAALIAPTQILAEQHYQTLQKLFPDIEIELITGKIKPTSSRVQTHNYASLHVGTHALINKLEKINPALIIYDEQHRFGVSQRSHNSLLPTTYEAHVLTMSATPIPRSYMLTIFSHLQLSIIDEMPAGRKPTKTWIVPEKKREDSYHWLGNELSNKNNSNKIVNSEDSKLENSKALALVVCPFIKKSKNEEFAHIPNATEKYEELQKNYKTNFPDLKLALLHGKLKQKDKDKITKNLFAQKIDILVTTTVIEVGLDVPTANIIVIEAAERFGMASLHQLRGRVGRAGQESYCLCFTSPSPNLERKSGHAVQDQIGEVKTTNPRLKEFASIHDGLKLAEKDLKRRGAGDLFGTRQHGLDNLQFADWTNLELITKARKVFEEIKDTNWQPIWGNKYENQKSIPKAN